MLSTKALIAVNRFGYGLPNNSLSPEVASTLMNTPKAWLLNQLHPENITQQLTKLNASWSSKEAIEKVALFREQKKMNKNNEMRKGDAKISLKASRKDINNEVWRLTNSTILQSINTDSPFYWRLVDLFSNHFSVTGKNLLTRALAPTLELEVIMPHLSGHFSDMLVAVQTHPAMLCYLDNLYSIGPNSPNATKSKNKRGLNENLAREILELHTLGVEGGYTQTDVAELAMALTGWSVGNIKRGEKGQFKFRKGSHEPGTRRILNKSYDQKWVAQGQAILYDLANHPSTARHISSKLVTHFVSDSPPTSIVDDMVDVWQASKGYLPKVIEAMLSHPLSWSERLDKFKTPREFVISACRVCGLKAIRPNFIRSLTILGQAPFSAGSPAGYKDTREYWAGPSAMMTRIEWAENVSRFVTHQPLQVANRALGQMLREDTAKHIQQAESKRQGFTLFLMSPEFQKK